MVNYLKYYPSISLFRCRSAVFSSEMMIPSLSSMTRETYFTCQGSWVTITIVCLYLVFNSLNNSSTSSEVFVSRFAQGSSANKTPGFFAIARATATRCFSPPESWFGTLFALPPRPTFSNASSEISIDSFFLAFLPLKKGYTRFPVRSSH